MQPHVCTSMKEKMNTSKKKQRGKKNLLLIKLAPLAYLFSLGVIYASNIKAILCSRHYKGEAVTKHNSLTSSSSVFHSFINEYFFTIYQAWC